MFKDTKIKKIEKLKQRNFNERKISVSILGQSKKTFFLESYIGYLIRFSKMKKGPRPKKVGNHCASRSDITFVIIRVESSLSSFSLKKICIS